MVQETHSTVASSQVLDPFRQTQYCRKPIQRIKGGAVLEKYIMTMARDAAIGLFKQSAALESIQHFIQKSDLNYILALESQHASIQDLTDKSRDIADDVCYWLKSEDDAKGLPVYLWEVAKRKTVIIKRVHDRPVHCTAISHTWDIILRPISRARNFTLLLKEFRGRSLSTNDST